MPNLAWEPTGAIRAAFPALPGDGQVAPHELSSRDRQQPLARVRASSSFMEDERWQLLLPTQSNGIQAQLKNAAHGHLDFISKCTFLWHSMIHPRETEITYGFSLKLALLRK